MWRGRRLTQGYRGSGPSVVVSPRTVTRACDNLSWVRDIGFATEEDMLSMYMKLATVPLLLLALAPAAHAQSVDLNPDKTPTDIGNNYSVQVYSEAACVQVPLNAIEAPPAVDVGMTFSFGSQFACHIIHYDPDYDQYGGPQYWPNPHNDPYPDIPVARFTGSRAFPETVRALVFDSDLLDDWDAWCANPNGTPTLVYPDNAELRGLESPEDPTDPDDPNDEASIAGPNTVDLDLTTPILGRVEHVRVLTDCPTGGNPG